MFALLAGLVAGLLHVFSGPDHLAAIAPLAVDGDSREWKTGLQWGMGHTTGVLLIALLLLLLRERLPLDAMSVHSERIVGLMLIAIGVWGIRGAWEQRCGGAGVLGCGGAGVLGCLGAGVLGCRGAGVQGCRGAAHGHSHSHAALRAKGSYTGASFAMGAIHGLAGSSHLFGVLPALALPSRQTSMLYLAGFGLGATAGMTAFAAMMGFMSHRLGRRQSMSHNGLLYASSAAAVVVGGVWLVG